MTYDPKFPYRINGGQVNADSVGVAYPTPVEEGALEVICTTEGIQLDLNGEKISLDPADLMGVFRIFHARNERNEA